MVNESFNASQSKNYPQQNTSQEQIGEGNLQAMNPFKFNRNYNEDLQEPDKLQAIFDEADQAIQIYDEAQKMRPQFSQNTQIGRYVRANSQDYNYKDQNE